MADETQDLTPTAPAPTPKSPVDVPLSEETAYSLQKPIVQEHDYQYAAVIELRRLRASIDAFAAALLQAIARTKAAMDAALPRDEIELKEPVAKAKPRHRDEAVRQAEALSMVEPEPQDDPVSLVEVEPEQTETKPKRG